MNIEPKLKFIKSNRNKDQLVVNNKYVYNLYSSDKKGNKSYIYTFYKTINKCKSMSKLNSTNHIVAYNQEHNHIISEKKVQRAKAKSEIKKQIQKLNNISEFNSLRSIINMNINKQFSKEIDSWNNKSDEHEYYKNLSGENFIIKKTDNYLLFQSKSLAKIHINNSNNFFCDATFYDAPYISYKYLFQEFNLKNFISFL